MQLLSGNEVCLVIVCISGYSLSHNASSKSFVKTLGDVVKLLSSSNVHSSGTSSNTVVTKNCLLQGIQLFGDDEISVRTETRRVRRSEGAC